MALRVPGPMGDAPVVVVTTTPKPQKLLRSIMMAPSTVITRAKTSDNAANLDASTLSYLHDKYGTRGWAARNSMRSCYSMSKALCGRSRCWMSIGAMLHRI